MDFATTQWTDGAYKIIQSVFCCCLYHLFVEQNYFLRKVYTFNCFGYYKVIVSIEFQGLHWDSLKLKIFRTLNKTWKWEGSIVIDHLSKVFIPASTTDVLLQAPGTLFPNFLPTLSGTNLPGVPGPSATLASIPHALLPLQAYDLVAPTINDDLEGTTRTSLQLKAREHAASLALIHVRNTIWSITDLTVILATTIQINVPRI